MPRWVAFLNFFVAFSFLPDPLAYFFKTGPFAWDGLLAWWVPVAAFFGWLLKTFIDYRRWLHVSRVQTEAHNKLLDRFTANDELLAYMRTPAGSRFLESAPISLDADAPAQAVSAPRPRWCGAGPCR